MAMIKDFFIPYYKWQLVKILSKLYPEDRWKFEKMRKKQLYAIYFNIRER